MSEPIFEQCVDERGNISVRVSRDVQVLTREEANRIEAEYKRMQAENAKLRELCETVIDDWMSKVCPTFPFCECGGEYESCADDTCGNQLYRQMLRELGEGVDW